MATSKLLSELNRRYFHDLFFSISRFVQSELNESRIFGDNLKDTVLSIEVEVESVNDNDINFKIRMYTRVPSFRSKFKDVNYYSNTVNVIIELNDVDYVDGTLGQYQKLIMTTDWDNYNHKIKFYDDTDFSSLQNNLKKLIDIVSDSMKYEIVSENYTLFKCGTIFDTLKFDDIDSSWFQYIFTKNYFNSVARYYDDWSGLQTKRKRSFPHIMCKNNRSDDNRFTIFIGDFSKSIYSINVEEREGSVYFDSDEKDTNKIFNFSIARSKTSIGSVIKDLLSYYDDIESVDVKYR